MDLFSPLTLGSITLRNRVVMAPMTRQRCGEDGVPTDLVARYYAARASVGLIVSEGTNPTEDSRGYPGQAGLVTDTQARGWSLVADAVHRRGGRIVVQLMHAGRVTHPAITGGRPVVAPSAVALDGLARAGEAKLPYPVPRALSTGEAEQVISDHAAAARRAVDAGLDGVEVHAANGYLVHQFLGPSTNLRNDRFGGGPDGRARFGLELVGAVAAEVGADRVGVRLSPAHGIQGVVEDDADDVAATYGALVDGLRPLGLAYLSLLHHEPGGALVQDLRTRSAGPLLINTGFASPSSRDAAVALVEAAHADAVVVGRPLIANPDLVERWRHGHPENEPDDATFYTGGERGYTDYATLPA